MLENFEAEHGGVLTEAQDIFVQRSKTRGQMWLETHVKREFDMIAEKLNRAEAAFSAGVDDPGMLKEYEDSLLDLINFAAFAVKKVRRGART